MYCALAVAPPTNSRTVPITHLKQLSKGREWEISELDQSDDV